MVDEQFDDHPGYWETEADAKAREDAEKPSPPPPPESDDELPSTVYHLFGIADDERFGWLLCLILLGIAVGALLLSMIPDE